MTAFNMAWGVVKGHWTNARRPKIKKDRCGACKTPTWPGQDEADALGIDEDEGQADGSMVDVGGGPPMWLCDGCALDQKMRGDN